MNTFYYGIDHLTVSKALAIGRHSYHGILSDEAIQKVQASLDRVNDIVAKGDTVYGINTGFGPLCNTRISATDTRQLQENIIRSHSVGVGNLMPKEITRLMLILKIHALAQGYSGIGLDTLRRMLWHLDQDLIPVVPEQGSVGASGDLAPLAHLFLPLIGLGQIWQDGKPVDTQKILQLHQKEHLSLGPKEGLALINGTQFILSYATVIVDRLHNCLTTADITGAMMIEALMGSAKPFSKALHDLRPFPGNQHVAWRVYKMLENSEILDSHLNCDRVQDPYSLRCIPQVHGTSRTAWQHLKELTEIELNAVTDNPIILHDGTTISGGNFHGQPLALPLDYAGLAASELGNISDRRIYLSLEGKVEGLPKLLMRDTGINSGFMLPQYTSAALVSENKSLLYPASGDSIPTSLGQEDHVSMGSISGRKTLTIIENLEKVLAVELLCAAQAFDFRRPLKSGPILEACHEFIRTQIDHAEYDRVFADDIKKALNIIQSRKLQEISEQELKHYKEINEDYYERFENY